MDTYFGQATSSGLITLPCYLPSYHCALQRCTLNVKPAASMAMLSVHHYCFTDKDIFTSYKDPQRAIQPGTKILQSIKGIANMEYSSLKSFSGLHRVDRTQQPE